MMTLYELMSGNLRDVHLVDAEEEHELATVVELNQNTLTAAGKAAWKDVLDAEVTRILNGFYGYTVALSGASPQRIRDFSFMLAGYCSESQYDEWVSNEPEKVMANPVICDVKFECKASYIRTERAQIDKVVVLSDKEYESFLKNTLIDYLFILENRDLMYVDGNDVRHCLLVKGESSDDGVAVDSQGFGYARYSAHIPDAKLLLSMAEPAIKSMVKLVNDVADYIAKGEDRVNDEGTIMRDFSYEELNDKFRINLTDEYTLLNAITDTLNQRSNISEVAVHEYGIYVEYADGMTTELDEGMSGISGF